MKIGFQSRRAIGSTGPLSNGRPLAGRRQFTRSLAVAAAASVALTAVGGAWAQAGAYPSRPIRMVVGFPPGGSSDATARLLGAEITARLGQQVVVENKPGANSILAAQYVRGQPADGYTLLSVSSSFAINPSLHKLNYDIYKDFAPIALLGTIPLCIVTPKQSKVKSVNDLIAFAKASPGKHSYASYGMGSAGHLASELLLSMTGTDMVHVPYRGSGPALVDVIGGQVEMLMPTVASSLAMARDGRLQMIAVSSSKRVSAVPDVPTIAESVPGFELVAWETIQAPAGTPPEIVAKLNKTINDILATPEFRERLLKLGIEPSGPKSPADVATFIRSEAEKFGKVIRERDIKPE